MSSSPSRACLASIAWSSWRPTSCACSTSTPPTALTLTTSASAAPRFCRSARSSVSAMCRSSMKSAAGATSTSRVTCPASGRAPPGTSRGSRDHPEQVSRPGQPPLTGLFLLRRLAVQEDDIGLGLVGLLDQLVIFAVAAGAARRVRDIRQIFVIVAGQLGIGLLGGRPVIAHADHFLRHAAPAGDDGPELAPLGP